MLQSIDSGTRVAVLGIGDVLHGDDAVGPLIARALRDIRRDWLIIDAGVSPEAYTGVLRGYQPELVVFVDAVEMAKAPGHSAWFERWQSDQVSAATHGLPLEVLADYLRAELGCRVALIGIQPATVELRLNELSAPVRAGADSVIALLDRVS